MAKTMSIVVPIYRVELYLDRCVESILAQTFQNFELILVDDGSPDRCPQMCDEWAQKDNRIQVIHKENGGLPDARNAGIAAATGAYLAFVDSDDWVEPDFLQTLYQGMVSNEADVVQCTYQQVYGTRTQIYRNAPCVMERESIETELLPQMTQDNLRSLANPRWNKCYRTQLVKDVIHLCDTTISMGEDFLMNFAVFGRCQKIVVLDTPPLYNYCFNPSSITATYDSKYRYEKDRYYQNLLKIAQFYNCLPPNIAKLKNHKNAKHIYECAISDWDREAKKEEIREIVSMLDRKQWLSDIRSFEVPAERICNYMTYCGMIEPMLWLVDIRKKMLRNRIEF